MMSAHTPAHNNSIHLRQAFVVYSIDFPSTLRLGMRIRQRPVDRVGLVDGNGRSNTEVVSKQCVKRCSQSYKQQHPTTNKQDTHHIKVKVKAALQWRLEGQALGIIMQFDAILGPFVLFQLVHGPQPHKDFDFAFVVVIIAIVATVIALLLHLVMVSRRSHHHGGSNFSKISKTSVILVHSS